MDQIQLIETALSSWGAEDVERLLENVSDDVIFQAHGSHDEVLGRLGIRGKCAFRDFLIERLVHFEYLTFEPTVLGICNNVARVQVKYGLHHRASGHELSCTQRIVLQIAGSQITKIDAYYDGPLVQAFLNLATADARLSRTLTTRKENVDDIRAITVIFPQRAEFPFSQMATSKLHMLF